MWHANTCEVEVINKQGVDIIDEDGVLQAVAFGSAAAHTIVTACNHHEELEKALEILATKIDQRANCPLPGSHICGLSCAICLQNWAIGEAKAILQRIEKGE